MATRPNDVGGPSGLPLNLIAQAVPKLTRNELASLCERLVDALDEIDGDSDFEPDDEDKAVDDDGCDEDFDREPDFALHEAPCCDLRAKAEHRARIRRTRCMSLRERDWRTGRYDGPVYGWRFWTEPIAPTKRQIFRRKRGLPRRPRA